MKEILLVEGARSPSDIFGKRNDLPATADEAIQSIRAIYSKLRSKLHPDHNQGNETRAAAAFQKFTEFYDRAVNSLKDGTYGKRIAVLTINTKKAEYQVFGPHLSVVTGKPVEWSQAASFFDGEMGGKPVLLKISNAPDCNQLLKNELTVIKELNRVANAPEAILKRFMKVIDSFETQIGGVNRMVIVAEHPGRIISLEDIASAQNYKLVGIDRKHIAWMWRRVLEALMHFEEAGYVYGAAVPSNILYNAETHEIRFMDFVHSVKLGEKITSIPTKWKSCYPDEVLKKEATVASTDTFIAAKAILPYQKKEHDTADKILQSYFAAATYEPAKLRTENAVTLYNRYDDIIHNRLNWQKKFVAFPITLINKE